MAIKNEFKSYRKKPIVIKAIQVKDFIKKVYKSPVEINGRWIWIFEKYIMIETEEGQMQAWLNDYLIIGIAGEIYPCKEEIFHKTYSIDN